MSDYADKLKILLPIKEAQTILSKIGNKTPLWAHWSDFVEERLFLGRSAVTITGIRDSLRYFIRLGGVTTIEECNDVLTVKNALFRVMKERSTGPSTYNTHRKNLSCYFNWLTNYEYIQENKLKKLPKAKEVLKDKPYLNDEQVKLVIGHIITRKELSTLISARNIAFVQILRFTGARPIELLRMKVSDINEEKDQLTVTIYGAKQKGQKRTYSIKDNGTANAIKHYLKLKEATRSNESKLFISASKRTGWTQKGMQKLFQKISKELGIKVTAYAFRRHVATKLWLTGLQPIEIMDYMGHSRLSTTRKYIEDGPDRTLKGAETMSGFNIN